MSIKFNNDIINFTYFINLLLYYFLCKLLSIYTLHYLMNFVDNILRYVERYLCNLWNNYALSLVLLQYFTIYCMCYLCILVKIEECDVNWTLHIYSSVLCSITWLVQCYNCVINTLNQYNIYISTINIFVNRSNLFYQTTFKWNIFLC